MKNIQTSSLALLALTFFSACSNDDNPAVYIPVNEEEVITTVTTTLTNGSDVVTLTSRDLDGDGPDAPVVTVSGPLKKNTVYTGAVTFLNELATPTDNITAEIEEESDEHQIFYQAPATFGSFAYTDTDVNGKPLGLNFTFTTGTDNVSGDLIITLIHEPNKNGAGVSDGDITNAAGSTDAQVIYPIIIAD
ncbi:MAG TPA: type 1 periplasmic binding fold superfamily protein [Flavobacterium sp.]|nr:type 1 periplasmic binding fold superfamily protein [Flavobacterium sp.]HPJ10748.1 type 1 periplasmic binding fold superfamily protein [Flavobacterium sp.]